MKRSLSTSLSTLLLLAFIAIPRTGFTADCPECKEVAKGKIPKAHLEKSFKKLPAGIVIWDNEEAMEKLKDSKAKVLWVDTRPGSFLKVGTLLPAVHMVCDLKGAAITGPDAANAISKDKLMKEMAKIDTDVHKVTVAFFCQGPECHRSYDAAIRSVAEYGLKPANVVWFRDGYPNLEKFILENPKLKKKIAKYLRGDVVNQ